MNPLYIAILGSWVRAGLLVVSTLLINHHIVNAQQGEALSTMWFDQIINALPAILALAWSSKDKIWARAKFMVALWMQRGATEAQVVDHIKSGQAVPALSTPPTTAPGVPSA